MSAAPPSILPAQSRSARAEQIQDRGAEVLAAVFRLTKTALVHAMDNDAAVDAVARCTELLQSFTREIGSAASMTFANDTVLVCGQLLRGSRGIYESAGELGKLLGRAGVTELRFQPGIGRESLRAFALAMATSLRDPERRDALLRAEIPGVEAQAGEPGVLEVRRDADAPPTERVMRFYATALVVMRSFYDDLAAGRRLVPHRVKRLAQRLVALAEEDNPALSCVAALAAAHRDDAARAVQSAVLSVLLGREITRERQILVRLATSALFADAGRVRLAAGSSSPVSALSEEEEAWAPGLSALYCLAAGGVSPQNAERAVTVFETAWLERRELLGPSPLGEPALLESELQAFVRGLVALLAPRDARPALSPAEAVEALARAPGSSAFLVRLLVRALGMIPAGSVVELESGEWAVVVAAPVKNASSPVVRVVTDASGRPLGSPVELDLGAPGNRVQIRRVLSASETRFNVARAFLQ